MKKIIFRSLIIAICSCAIMNTAQAQINDADPAVTSLSFVKSPIDLDEVTTLTVFVINNGFDTSVATGSIGLRIALPAGAEYTAYPESATQVTGTYAGYFNWTYNSSTKEFLGVSNQPILAGEGGNVIINIRGNIIVDDEMSYANIVTINPAAYPNENATNNSLDIALTVEPGATLPVKLLSFIAAKQNSAVRLTWETSSEFNSSHFEVQTSQNGSDWQSIGTVQAAGNSSTKQQYSFVHNSPAKSVNYYRLKQVDIDAKFDYSIIRVVSFSTSSLITVLPNPTADKVFITSNSTGLVRSVTVYSAAGNLMQRTNSFAFGNSIDLSRYAPGVYFIKIIDENGQAEVLRVVRK